MNPAEEGRFDDVFLPVLSHLGKMDGFLEHIFNFLSRRTDFYRIMKTETDTMGFMPGVAEKLVRNYFVKYQQMAQGVATTTSTPPSKQQTSPTAARSASKPINTTHHTAVSNTSVAPSKNSPAVQEPAANTTAGTKATSAQATAVDSSDVYNGDTTERFSWSQTATDVDIKIPVPAGTKASEVRVNIQAKHVRASVVSAGKETVLVDDELADRVRVSECMWSKDGDRLLLSLEKHKDYLWKSAFADGPEIDLNKADNTRQLTDYDDDTQQGVRKAMYDQEQKMKGLPTSDEQKTLSVLEKAWNAEGSPFQGTDYDPSVLNLSGSTFSGGLPPDAT